MFRLRKNLIIIEIIEIKKNYKKNYKTKKLIIMRERIGRRARKECLNHSL